MKTTRLIVMALSVAALVDVAITPVPPAAGAPASSPCSALPWQCLKGNFAFRLASAKSFSASMASAGDPANVGIAPLPKMSLVRTGALYADGLGNVSGHTQTTVNDQFGNTTLVDYPWTGTYTLNGDLAGTLNITPVSPPSTWLCTTMSGGASPYPCTGIEVGPESYAISLSLTYDSLNMIETDNNAGGGKIFMTGQALKR